MFNNKLNPLLPLKLTSRKCQTFLFQVIRRHLVCFVDSKVGLGADSETGLLLTLCGLHGMENLALSRYLVHSGSCSVFGVLVHSSLTTPGGSSQISQFLGGETEAPRRTSPGSRLTIGHLQDPAPVVSLHKLSSATLMSANQSLKNLQEHKQGHVVPTDPVRSKCWVHFS